MKLAAGSLLLLLLSPPASAQAEPVFGENLGIAVVCDPTFLFPNYAGGATANCEVKDLSRDSLVLPGQPGGTSLSQHVLTFTFEPLFNETNYTSGWQVVLSKSTAYPFGGDTVPFTVDIKVTPLVARQDFQWIVHVDYDGPNGYRHRESVNFSAEVNNYDFAVVSMEQHSISQKVGQDQIVRYEVQVHNVAVYPDSYRFSVKADPDLLVSVPPNLYVPAGETRSAYVDVLTPHGKLFEIGRSTTVLVKVNSLTGSGVYGATGVLAIRGFYIPTYWIPLLLVGLVSASVVVRGSREKTQLHRRERGRPRHVELTPRQAVLLAELRREDPETYKEKKKALDTVYHERTSDYRAHRRERAAADRQEAKIARAEFLAAKKARKAKRKEEKRAALLAKKQAAHDEKLRRRDEKREAKLVKKKEKVLAKTRAKLEKQQAKAAARDAKLAAKQAKIDAKAAKQEQAAQKKAERDARKKQ